MGDTPHLDEEALAELQDVMEDEFDVLIETYISDSGDRIASLRQAMEAGDASSFSKAAHSFKGSCINIGAPRLGQLCMEAEAAGSEGRLEQAAEMLDSIESEFQTVCRMLKGFLTS